MELAGIDPVDARIPVQLDTPIAQHRLEGIAYRAVVRRQDGATRIQQVEVQVVRIPPCGAQFVAQPVLHGQRQLDAPGPGPDDCDIHHTGMADDPLEQREPALVEGMDGLDGDGVLGRARHVGEHRG